MIVVVLREHSGMVTGGCNPPWRSPVVLVVFAVPGCSGSFPALHPNLSPRLCLS